MSTEIDDIDTEITSLTNKMNAASPNLEMFLHYCGRSEDLKKIVAALKDLDTRINAIEP